MKIGFLTQHGKERLLADRFREALGADLVRVTGFDTDELGTFTRERPRPGTQFEAAARKAELALELSDADYGLGSEGAFHLDPYLSVLPWNTEMLVLIERATGHRVAGLAHGKAVSVNLDVRGWEALAAGAERAGFPHHHLVLRDGGPEGPVLARGLSEPASLRAAFERVTRHDADRLLHLENDLRAHTNPTRQGVIREAGEELIRRLRSRCPACGARGFGLDRTEAGAPCALCGSPTGQPMADIWTCGACGHAQRRPRPEPVLAPPERCDVCNP